MKKPACASKRDMLELATLWYIAYFLNKFSKQNLQTIIFDLIEIKRGTLIHYDLQRSIPGPG